ncbi:MAG: hypothetical protein QOI56_264, partial [Actinomycetota bacterium]|nr:hypothetical protein [Actinomycetota bacterium]
MGAPPHPGFGDTGLIVAIVLAGGAGRRLG